LRQSRRCFAPLFGMISLAMALLVPAQASAGTYGVEVCTATSAPLTAGDLDLVITPGLGFLFQNGCSPNGELNMRATGPTARSGIDWQLNAPPRTRFTEIALERSFPSKRPWDTRFQWVLVAPGHTLEQVGLSSEPVPADDPQAHYAVNSDHLNGVLECANGATCTGGDGEILAEVKLKNIFATIEDNVNPKNVSATAPAGPLRGTAGIPYKAEDEGGGVAITDLETQAGAVIASDHDDNGGLCVAEGRAMVPCAPKITNREIPLDTTLFADGPLTLTVFSIDPAHNVGLGNTFTVMIHNAPTSTDRPVLGGEAKVGQVLSATDGQWVGFPVPTFTHQWLRCPPGIADKSETGCDVIDGATGATYTATAPDAGKRLVAKVTATNTKGAEVALSAPSAVVSDQLSNKAAPSISGTPNVGSQLKLDTGKWEDLAAAKVSFAQQWLRCPVSVTTAAQSAQCDPISGATATTYAATKADVSMRLIAKVTASVSAPQALSSVAASAPTAPVTETGGGNEGGNAPQTKIAKHPRKKTALRKAKFTFSSDQPGSSFQCKLDKGPFKTCRSPYKRKVKPGRHSLQVRAVNPAGVADPTPAKFAWRVSP
jgi:hypothetical protein